MESIAEGYPDVEAEEEAVDPRIQSELNHLNVASTEINRLENELDEARSKYRSIISETSNRMEIILRDQKRSVQKSREYYKLMAEAKIAQAEALKAARQFQTSTTVYKAAKETVALAECRLVEETSESTAAQLTSAWQEMLNHAIEKVTVAEREKSQNEQEHKRRAAKFAELESKIQMQEKKFARSIKKSRPYFEMKAELDIKLMQQKQNVNDLLTAIKSNKRKYQETLRRLEKISEEIHESRHEKFWSKVPRLPGVGAETDSIASSLSELGKESIGYESDLESTNDTDKDELDLRLDLELGGKALSTEADKTPAKEDTKELNDTLVCQPDDVIDSERVSSDTVGQDKGTQDIGATAEQSFADGPHNKDEFESKSNGNSGANHVKVQAYESGKSAGEDGAMLRNKDQLTGTSNDSENSGAENPIIDNNKTSTSEMAETDSDITVDKDPNQTSALKSVINDNKQDSDGDFTESFESCHEEQTQDTNLDNKDNPGDAKDLASGTAKTDDLQVDMNITNDAKPDMATVERPSLSGAED